MVVCDKISGLINSKIYLKERAREVKLFTVWSFKKYSIYSWGIQEYLKGVLNFEFFINTSISVFYHHNKDTIKKLRTCLFYKEFLKTKNSHKLIYLKLYNYD